MEEPLESSLYKLYHKNESISTMFCWEKLFHIWNDQRGYSIDWKRMGGIL